MKHTATAPLQLLGRASLERFQELGQWFFFLCQSFAATGKVRAPLRKAAGQVYLIGAKSVSVIVAVGLFTGMVLGLQGYHTLSKFASEGLLGTAVALSLVRELGPVLAAIMVVARAGSAMTAEIGIMRNAEQIDALETMDIHPLGYLVAPRLWGALVVFPLLTAIFDIIGIWGGYGVSVWLLDLPPGIYLDAVRNGLQPEDVAGGFYKSFCFALLATSICCFRGYFTHIHQKQPGAKGVSRATTSAVVVSCVTILISDYILTSFLL